MQRHVDLYLHDSSEMLKDMRIVVGMSMVMIQTYLAMKKNEVVLPTNRVLIRSVVVLTNIPGPQFH